MFHCGKDGTRFIVEGGILFRFLVELDVQIDQRVALTGFDGGTVAPSLVRNDHLAELGTPVAEVVDADAVIAAEGVQLL